MPRLHAGGSQSKRAIGPGIIIIYPAPFRGEVVAVPPTAISPILIAVVGAIIVVVAPAVIISPALLEGSVLLVPTTVFISPIPTTAVGAVLVVAPACPPLPLLLLSAGWAKEIRPRGAQLLRHIGMPMHAVAMQPPAIELLLEGMHDVSAMAKPCPHSRKVLIVLRCEAMMLRIPLGAAPHDEDHLLGLLLHQVHQLKPGSSNLRADPPFREVVPKVGNAQGLEGQGCVPQPLQDGVDARVRDRVVPETTGLQLLLQLAPDPLGSFPAFTIDTRVPDEAERRH